MKKLFSLIKPFAMISSILDVDNVLNYLPCIKLIFIDVDNTILSYKATEISCYIMHWIDMIARHKMIIFVTNNSPQRIRQIADFSKYKCICNATKPFPFVFLNYLKKNNLSKDECLIIGDQLFDDVLGGNLAGIKTILTNPIEKESAYRMKIKRYFEFLILKHLECI